ncbi:hypothetical protein [Terrisporobacter sp.]|uniref:hypothetical protein n=1 Tax=Terrisporobacter sp. TaxID=1965305 RepID=UPI00289DD9B4|nr:hypothetical protein [Terrisporobacter sp.]
MATPVTDIYDIFLSQIGKDIMLELSNEIVEDLLYGYLLGATVEFSYYCNKDLAIKDGNIVDDLDRDEKFILSKGMILYWLQPKINTQEVIKNRITDGDYVIKSPANLLDKLLKLKLSSESDMRRMIIKYSHKGRNINE